MMSSGPTQSAAKPPPTHRRLAWLAVALGILVALAGLVAGQWRELFQPRHRGATIDWAEQAMDPLQRFSYDLPFILRYRLPVWLYPLAGGNRDTSDVVILLLDETSAARLGQPSVDRWNRGVHAQLLEKLTADGARAVVFDAIFDAPSPEDERFVKALRENGRAYLGAALDTNLARDVEGTGGFVAEKLLRREPAIYAAARGWGLLTLRPVESDQGITRIFTGKPRAGFAPWPALSWMVARDLGAELEHDDDPRRFSRRWINYYGPSGRLLTISYYRVLDSAEGIPPGFFKDRIVFVGARTEMRTGSATQSDSFSTPWSHLLQRPQSPGVEIHATVLLNLLRDDWLERWPSTAEKGAVVLFGLALGALVLTRPARAMMIGALIFGAVLAGACLTQWQARRWLNWAVPALVQLPLGLGLAVAGRYYLEEKRKRQLRQAFGFYLSPDLADQIADHDFNLAPGGEKIVATMIFTDLEGFTTLSEKLGDAGKLGQVLTDYFTRTTDQILAEKGTVIKFIGDAVFAAWNAPLPQPDHAERAVRAAWRLAQVSEMDVPIPQLDGSVESVHVRTRIGIHTGEALAGNLGSASRFDYTLIGDAVNFAARLEGANKYTGTTILLSEDTLSLIAGKFLVRRLGAFKVKGKSKAVSIYELLGEDPTTRPEWLDRFDAALQDWNRGALQQAATGFSAVSHSRGGRDGPSQFYLDRIATFHEGRMQAMTLAPMWSADVELEGK